MVKSLAVTSLDNIQAALRPRLQQEGFRVRGRTFNRKTIDGLTHVVNLQMGASDPPGTYYIPGLRENLYGMFAVNLGVYIPEVARKDGAEPKAWIQEPYCSIRVRLGALIGDGRDIWWNAITGENVIDDVSQSLDSAGLPFLDRLSTRDQIVNEWTRSAAEAGGSPERIVKALILAERGDRDQARTLLSQQILEARDAGHVDYVRTLAQKIGLGKLG